MTMWLLLIAWPSMPDAIKAPRGSRFLDELNRPTPAWHHYLSNIEKLVTGIVATDTGTILADVAARLDKLEATLDEAEKVYSEKNWGFFHDPAAPLITEPDTDLTAILAAHSLGTKHVCARYEYTSDKHYSFNNSNRIYDENSCGAGIAGSDSDRKAWVLGFYGY